MKKSSMLIPISVMLVILAVLLVFMRLPFGQTHGGAEAGVLDFRAEDLSRSVYQLTGQWQYAPGEICDPAVCSGRRVICGNGGNSHHDPPVRRLLPRHNN